MKTIFLFLSLISSLTAFSLEIQSYRYNKAQQLLTLTVTYQGGCLAHQLSLDLDTNCDFEGAVGGTLLDSGIADTCESEDKTQSFTVNLNNYKLQCTPNVLYIFTAPRDIPVRIQL